MQVKIFTFLEYAKLLGTRDFSREVLKKIKPDINGYAGYKYKEGIKGYLNELNDSALKSKGIKFPEIYGLDKKCRLIAQKAVKKVERFVTEKRLFIYVFPQINKWVIGNMNGLGGRTVWKNTICLEIFPKKGWEKEFVNTMIHELTHVATGYYFGGKYSFGECFVHEGLAENFREFVLGGKEPWTKAMSETKAMSTFFELKREIRKKPSMRKYSEIFFGTGKYPNWTGYTIGYYLVKSYLKSKYKNRKIDWKEVFETKPLEISKEWL